MKTQTLHFTLGEDAGLLFMQIAQEHLIYNFNPEKAVKTITEGLGCEEDLALKILKGDIVLLVDEDGLNFIGTEYHEGIHNKIGYKNIDFCEWHKNHSRKIYESSVDLLSAVNKTLLNLSAKSNQGFSINIDYKTALSFISGNIESLNDLLDENPEISELSLLIDVVKKFTERSYTVQKSLNWVFKTYNYLFPADFKEKEEEDYEGALTDLLISFQRLMKLDFEKEQIQQKELSDFVQKSIEIDNVLSKEIMPVNIMDNYSAGWLSPKGDFYGINGDMAHMLHNQIAEALQEKGIVPVVDKYDNPHAWLSKNGWVKIHNNRIQYEGCLNYKFSLHDIDMTDIQINIIFEYIRTCHNSIMRLGWKELPTTCFLFKTMATNNLPLLNKTYFDFYQ